MKMSQNHDVAIVYQLDTNEHQPITVTANENVTAGYMQTLHIYTTMHIIFKQVSLLNTYAVSFL